MCILNKKKVEKNPVKFKIVTQAKHNKFYWFKGVCRITNAFFPTIYLQYFIFAAYIKMNAQENILPNVSSQNTVSDIDKKITKVMSDCLRQSMKDFTQQTMMDVNSQPLMPATTTIKTAKTETQLDCLTLARQALPAITEDNMQQQHQDQNSTLITEFYENFSVGKTYQTLEELRSTAFEYGRKHNVALTTSKSDKTKIYLICKHGGHYRKNLNKKNRPETIKTRIRKSQKNGCRCLIYARCCKGTHWTIRKSIGEHNHPISEDPRTYAMYRSLKAEHLSMVHKLLKENMGISNIVKSLTAKGVNNIVAKDIENIQQDMKRKEAAAKNKQVVLFNASPPK